jgi:hypothetical protein
MPCLALACAILSVFAAAAAAQTRSIFDLPTGRASRAIVTIEQELPEIAEGEPQMSLVLAGVLVELKGRGFNQLRATVPPNPMLGDAGNAEQLCTIHLVPAGTGESKRIAIYQADADFIAVELDDQGLPQARALLRRDAFAELYHSWPQYRGAFDGAGADHPRAQVFKLEQPYAPGRFTIDKPTAANRLYGGSQRSQGADRILESCEFNVRLPRGYNPRAPAGLLVWVDAGPSGICPPIFDAALDELNIIAIGAANSGNNRTLVNRVQLALDAAATASRRFHIDSRRIYISGISGGGRVASITQICFPEVFAGSVPIVGMSCYQNVPDGLGRYYRAEFSKPGSAVFHLTRQRRIAPMTGRHDGNLLSITHGADLLRRDGIPVRVWEDPKMGHELPKSADAQEALHWIDEPYRALHEQEEQAAAKALESYTTRFGERPPANATERMLLLRVLEAGPWTQPAWTAWDLLNRNAATPKTR